MNHQNASRSNFINLLYADTEITKKLDKWESPKYLEWRNSIINKNQFRIYEKEEMSIHQLVTDIVPMLAISDPNVQISDLQPDWIFDTKMDGIRALAAWDTQILTLRNRTGRIMDNYQDLEVAAHNIPGPVILDGEIVTASGKFQDAAWRDKQRGPKALSGMDQHPAHFKAFDILWHPDLGDVRNLPLTKRRQLLILLNLEMRSGGGWGSTEASYDPKFYKFVCKHGGEGVIAKYLHSSYESGRTTCKSWLKFKSTFTVTCVGTGYEPGKGARSAFGGMHIAMLGNDGETFINVGKVGSGFTLLETLDMKEQFDYAKSDADLPIVEIQCYNRTREDKLRMPVYLGQRSDMTITDTNIKQLLTLPKT